MESSRTDKSVDYLTRMPPELIYMVIEYLSAADLARFAWTNKAMRHAYNLQAKQMYLNEAVWIRTIQNAGAELIVETSDGNVFARDWQAGTFRLLYQKEHDEILIAQDKSYFVLKNGKVKAWGDNSDGQLGLLDDEVLEPETVGIDDRVAAVVPAGSFTYFLLENGRVMVCGLNGHGQLGLGRYVQSSSLALIPDLSNVKKISASADSVHVFFLLNDGRVKSCGMNVWGQLGLGREGDSFTPQLIEDLENVVDVVAGPSSYFILNNGTVKSCGFNHYENLGYRTLQKTENFKPKIIPDLCHVVKARPGYHGVVFVLDDGTLRWVGYTGRSSRLSMGNQYANIQKLINNATHVNDVMFDEVYLRYSNTNLVLLCQDDYGRIDISGAFNPFTVSRMDPSIVDVYLRGLVTRVSSELQKCLAGTDVDGLLVLAQRKKAYGENCFYAALKMYQQARPASLTLDRLEMLQASPWCQTERLREVFPAYDELIGYINTHTRMASEGLLSAYQLLFAMFCYLRYQNTSLNREQDDFIDLMRTLALTEMNGKKWKYYLSRDEHLYTSHKYHALGMKLFDYKCSQTSDYTNMRSALKKHSFSSLQAAANILAPAILRPDYHVYLA